jgi:hypothetical protein
MTTTPLVLAWHHTAELPAVDVWWFDGTGALIDMTAAVSFTLRIGRIDRPALIQKTSGITGAVGAGVAPTGTPNVTIAWAAGELDIAPGVYTAQLTARFAGDLDRVMEFAVRVRDTVDQPTP